ncbi:chitinase-3-like protein 2 [Drosophila grimshawi]|uniref:GH17567 n=1 Tax=Drosophila grimshawi TaxID=7222 RepID=B4JXI2_DROGR|nr:chitinase-3-like protein 2 [Drosophila grimshawi]EDV95458.1 GH17567 [Drosophila grimshawi]
MVNYTQLQDQIENRSTEDIRQRHDLVIRYILLFAFIVFICVTLIPLCLLIANPNGVQQQQQEADKQRFVCYYDASSLEKLRLLDVPGTLCTHINIGIVDLLNGTLQLSPRLKQVLQNETRLFRSAHPQVKLLLWIGGSDSGHQFAETVMNHTHRKIFLRSLKSVMHQYPQLDGIDLDWEFPRAYDNERMHFAQLLHEIRLEWRREKRTDNLLSLAVAAPEGIAFFAYNIREINLYVDYVNLMTYDFHFYREDTPFTGLNAPLYARPSERSIMGTFNINYTAHWWLSNGLEPHRLVIGLPTYGHSFTLVNPFNVRIGAPASGFGKCGQLGFTTLSQTCECANNFLAPIYTYDKDTCSPYLSELQEWISYESKTSISCKANYVKSLNVGGLMIFSLNTDDLKNSCGYMPRTPATLGKPVFPLAEAASSILRNRQDQD